VPPDVDKDLTRKAEVKINYIVAQWNALQAKGPVSREKKEEFRFRMNYIQDIWSGQYPYGLNTEEEERWSQLDIGCCLDPAFDNHDYIHELNPRNIAYLNRLAENMKQDLVKKVEEKPSLKDDPYTIAHAARLDAFLKDKVLPTGWRLEPPEEDMKVNN
jgi:hypothetical protein